MKIKEHDAVKKYADCPRCGASCKKHSVGRRTLKDLQHTTWRVRYSKHYCRLCRKYFNAGVPGARDSARYMDRVMDEALRMLESRTLEQTAIEMERVHGIKIPISTIFEWKTELGT